MLGLIAAAIAGGKALYGAVSANQKKQRNKGFIDANYRLAKEKLETRQAGIRQSTDESLIARGILSNRAVPMGEYRAPTMKFGTGPMAAPVVVPGTARAHDLSGQVQQQQAHQFGLEDKELDLQREQAHRENKAQATNAIISSITNSVGDAVGMYNAGSALRAANAAGAEAGGGSAIRDAMGVDGPMPGAYGVDVVDPLGAPGSAWNAGDSGATLIGGAQPNYAFNVRPA